MIDRQQAADSSAWNVSHACHVEALTRAASTATLM